MLALCVAPVIALFALVPDLLMRVVGGRGYQGAAELVLPLGIAMSLMSFSNALLLYRLSTGRLRFWAALPLLVALEAAVLGVFRGSPLEFAWAVAGMNGVFLVVAGVVVASRSSSATSVACDLTLGPSPEGEGGPDSGHTPRSCPPSPSGEG
jgi:O-antigen/teichoic acid export membrane protein